jgi:acetyl-CoA synthetase
VTDPYTGFTWTVPERFNIGVDVVDRWAEREGRRLALVHVAADGRSRRYSFAEVAAQSNRLANLLRRAGIGAGDRVGVFLPQAPETAFAHVAIYKVGAIAVPLFTPFGPDAVLFRLADSGAVAAITNAEGAAKLAPLRERLSELRHVWSSDGAGPGTLDLSAEMAGQSEAFEALETAADDPALLIYTSGTTGQPKGALHAHRVLLGHLPGVEVSHDLLPQDGDRMWTPADWAWIGGLLDVLWPAWHHGVPVVAHRFAKFTGEAAFQLMADHGVRNTFLPPTALKIMRGVADSRSRYRYALRTVASGGESLGSELLSWGRAVFGLTINEFYGQTECNMTVSGCSARFATPAGAIGRAAPGHRVAIVDGAGRELPPGQLGTIAVRRPDPVMFLGYWNNPAATRAKFAGDWLLTGDQGTMDDTGFVHFVGRDDDVINSAGYRIGPGEVEDCMLRHPAVQLVAVVGVPDPERTEIVAAAVVLNDGYEPSDDLTRALQNHVRTRLAAHEYPRRIEYVDELPLTTTGKIIRRVIRERLARAPSPARDAAGSVSRRRG